jgi:hypothetical protein
MKYSALFLALFATLSQAGETRGFITLEGERENIHGTGNDVDSFNLIPGIKSGDFTYDLKVQAQSKDDNKTSANIEPRIKYDHKIGMTDFTVWGRLGLGEKITSDGNFGYYTIEPGISYNVIKGGKLFVSDRYRDSFSDGKGYTTNTVYVGGSYDVNSFDTISAKFYRKYQDTESNGIEVAYTRWF